MTKRIGSKKSFLTSFAAITLVIIASIFITAHKNDDINVKLNDLREKIGQECKKLSNGFAEDCDEGINAVGKEQLNKNSDVVSKQNDKLIITLENGEKTIFQDKSGNLQDESDGGTDYVYDYFFRDLGFHAIRERSASCSSGDTKLINAKTGKSTSILSHYYYWKFSPDGKEFLVYTCSGIQIWEIRPYELKLKYEEHDKCESGLKKATWTNNHTIEFISSHDGKNEEKVTLRLDGDVWKK